MVDQGRLPPPGARGDREADPLAWLQAWYAARCDGIWEHTEGVEITNIDNPGWRLVVTGLHSEDGGAIEVAPLRLDRNEEDWIHVLAGAGRFEAFCGPGNLGEALRALRAVVEG